jgi:phosphoserine phosphatase RsbU/P
MSRFRFIAIHIGIGIISLAIIIILYPFVHYFAGIYLPANKSIIEERAFEIIRETDLDPGDTQMRLTLQNNRNLYVTTIRQKGIAEANSLMRNELPVFFWNVRWSGSLADILGGSLDEDIVVFPDPTGTTSTTLLLSFDGNGSLLRYEANIPDTIALTTIDTDAARRIAQTFLQMVVDIDFDRLSFDSHKEERREVRTDHTFVWSSPTKVEGLTRRISVAVAGNRVVSFNTEYDAPRVGFLSTIETVNALTSSVPYVAIGIAMLIVLIRRIRVQEIGFRYGMIVGTVAALAVLISMLIQFIGDFNIFVLIPLILGPIIVGAFFVPLWAVTESVGREIAKEKFISLDLLFRGHFLHSHIGRSLIRGGTYGLVACAILLSLLWSFDHLIPIWYLWAGENPVRSFSPPLSSLKIVSDSVLDVLFAFSMLIVFLYSVFAHRMPNKMYLTGTIAVIFGITYWSLILPFGIGVFATIVLGVVLIFIYYRFDALTTFLTFFTFIVVYKGIPLFFSGNDYLLGEGLQLVALAAVTGTVAIASLFTKDTVTDYEAIAPAFQRYISERERMQRELEIAHDVQMSFLPKRKPDIPELDVASVCIPAHEVGGDYYDFIRIDEHRFGVVIGDVSGKGTKASFYMTLTKGILRSTARNETNPARVLSRVNRTFYESAERGAFISMVYGIFDLKEKTLTVARAGHNPVILWKSTSANGELINPDGIALGLDEGSLFDQSIRETRLRYEPEDVFIFYTDGFSEAIDKRNEEFGDERLLSVARKHTALGAEELLGGLVKEVNTFTGRIPQRDDMTMVVVKIRSV